MLLWTLVACGGDDETETPPTCSIATEPLSAVPADQWDPGMGAAVDGYVTVAGNWDVGTDCPIGATTIVITAPPEEQIGVVTTPPPEGAVCGCASDPDFDDDGAYGPIGTFANLTMFVESWDDPGLQAATATGSGALFGEGAPYQVRGCASANIDPVKNSAYDSFEVLFRLDRGSLSGSVVLHTDAGGTESCSLTGWSEIAL